MTVQTYLRNRLTTAAHHELDQNSQRILSEIGMEEFIASRLFAKKFRKWKLDDACVARTKHAIKTQVSAEQPLQIVYPQGGYKLWRLPSSPTADWAEFFVVGYVLEYLAPIAAAYKPGVEVTFYLHTLLMELHDNLTTAEINLYVSSLQTILDEYQKHCPQNIQLKILRDADIYTRDEYFQALEKGKELAAKDFATWPAERKADYRRMSELNIKWHGNHRWDLLSEVEKEQKIYNAALYEIAATQNLPRVFETVNAANKILLFTKPSKDFIGIGSTKTSVAKYWVGYGVLETDGQRFYERVLTPSQWEHCRQAEFHTEKVTLIKLPNLQSIHVFPRLDFSKS